ncbi:hypothetical protein KC19_7G188500, partial [Ceratodon purpureus]
RYEGGNREYGTGNGGEWRGVEWREGCPDSRVWGWGWGRGRGRGWGCTGDCTAPPLSPLALPSLSLSRSLSLSLSLSLARPFASGFVSLTERKGRERTRIVRASRHSGSTLLHSTIVAPSGLQITLTHCFFFLALSGFDYAAGSSY